MTHYVQKSVCVLRLFNVLKRAYWVKLNINAFVQRYFSLYPTIFGQKDLNAFLLFASDVIFERRSEIRIAILSV